jgi:hypothetical protein
MYLAGENTRVTKPRSDEQQATNQVGEYTSPNGACKAVLNISSLGGFKVLTLTSDRGKPRAAKDVTGIAWAGSSKLVYTTSPVYGRPGVYVYDCDSNKLSRILAARNMNKAYPNGADYLELRSVSSTDPVVVFLYYAPDVDTVDFKAFRSAHYLYQVHPDGTDFKKTE